MSLLRLVPLLCAVVLPFQGQAQPAARIPVGTLLGTMGALVGTLPGLAIAFTQFCLSSCSPDRTVETLGLVVASAGALLGGTWVIDRTPLVAVSPRGGLIGGLAGTF